MLRRLGDRRRAQDSDGGFTVLELSVTAMISAVVLAIAGGALVSLENATNRNDSRIKEEQAASLVMAQVERDIRSAASISFPAGASPTDQLELSVGAANGTTTTVLWIYDPAGGTFTRQTMVNGSFVTSGTSMANVSNGGSTPVFTYDDFAGSQMATTSPSNIAQCATGVGVDVHVSSPTTGVGSFEETAEVALTNRIQILTAPGNGTCGSP